MAREYFMAFHSMRGAMRKLTDEEVGRLFRALLLYSETGEDVELEGREAILFDVFAQQIDREVERYAATCAKNKANRNHPPVVTSRDQPSPVVTNGPQEKEEEKDKEKDKDKEKAAAQLRRFDRFWAAYPKKAAKPAALKAFMALKPDDALTDTMIAAVEAAKVTPQWLKDRGQYIPHPATWLHQRRWEDCPEPGQGAGTDYGGNADYGGDL